MSPTTTKIGQYLFSRLRQLGVKSVFGVPGDYNLKLLDYVEPAGLRWIGNCNELNAAYATDGYARMSGLGALVTTFGVGELSASNGIAGAYAEKAPVVHIVGTPARDIQQSRAPIHHTFADGEYRRFAAMHSHITIAQANLTDPRTAVGQINRLLNQARLYSRPVYLEIPDDMVNVTVDIADQNHSAEDLEPLQSVSGDQAKAVECVLEKLYSAKRPLILVDGDSRPCGILDKIDTIVQTTGWPTFMTTSGKGLVNEELPNVYGVYTGSYGQEAYKTYFDTADLVLHLGPHISDTNSQLFTTLPRKEVTVSLAETEVQIEGQKFGDLSCRQVVEQMMQGLNKERLASVEALPEVITSAGSTDPNGLITQDKFYRFVNPVFRAGDVVLTETGTASHGGRYFNLPQGVRMFAATTWLSIGYMLPATLGAAQSQREKAEDKPSKAAEDSSKPCTILFIGDGSLQMSVQEISTMIKQKLDVIIFILNNDGYTIERAIHGKNQSYNDVASWRYLDALRFFGDNAAHAEKSVFAAKTWGELDNVLKEVRKGSGVRLVEVAMEREDCQDMLLDLMKLQANVEG